MELLTVTFKSTLQTVYISYPLGLSLQLKDPLGGGTNVVVVGIGTKSQDVAEQTQL